MVHRIRINPSDVFLPETLIEALLEYVDFSEPPLDLLEIFLLRADAMIAAISTGALDKPEHLADAAQAEVQTAQAVLDAWRRQERRAAR